MIEENYVACSEQVWVKNHEATQLYTFDHHIMWHLSISGLALCFFLSWTECITKYIEVFWQFSSKVFKNLKWLSIIFGEVESSHSGLQRLQSGFQIIIDPCPSTLCNSGLHHCEGKPYNSHFEQSPDKSQRFFQNSLKQFQPKKCSYIL